jgi:hypothetical protein
MQAGVECWSRCLVAKKAEIADNTEKGKQRVPMPVRSKSLDGDL